MQYSKPIKEQLTNYACLLGCVNKSRKLDGVGPVYNRPSSDKLHLFIVQKVQKVLKVQKVKKIQKVLKEQKVKKVKKVLGYFWVLLGTLR